MCLAEPTLWSSGAPAACALTSICTCNLSLLAEHSGSAQSTCVASALFEGVDAQHIVWPLLSGLCSTVGFMACCLCVALNLHDSAPRSPEAKGATPHHGVLGRRAPAAASAQSCMALRTCKCASRHIFDPQPLTQPFHALCPPAISMREVCLALSRVKDLTPEAFRDAVECRPMCGQLATSRPTGQRCAIPSSTCRRGQQSSRLGTGCCTLSETCGVSRSER